MVLLIQCDLRLQYVASTDSSNQRQNSIDVHRLDTNVNWINFLETKKTNLKVYVFHKPN